MIPTIVTLQMIAGLLMPPATYDHYPAKPFRLIEVEARIVAAVCPKADLALACAFPKQRQLFIRDDLDDAVRAKVLRHEYAHLNGWRH